MGMTLTMMLGRERTYDLAPPYQYKGFVLSKRKMVHMYEQGMLLVQYHQLHLEI
jgi:hypothetical protein